MPPNPQIARNNYYGNTLYHWLTAYASMCKNKQKSFLVSQACCYTLGLASVTTCINFLRGSRTNKYLKTNCIDNLLTSGSSSLKKGGLSRKGSFDITFQHKITLSLTTRNRPMNFEVLPNFRNPSCYFVSD